MPYYRFTGKELDPETGLYYYGARYYDPVLSRWISADPIIEAYLPDLSTLRNSPFDSLPSKGGVYKPINLNAYAYSHNNPLRYFDPDGNAVFESGEELLKVGNEVIKNDSLKPQQVKTKDAKGNEVTYTQTYCNYGVQQIEEKGGNTDYSGLKANEIIEKLEDPKYGTQVIPEKAVELAKQGVTVIAGAKNKSGSGHVAIVAPTDMEYSGSWGKNVPQIFNVGKSNKLMRVSEGFSQKNQPNYYVRNADLERIQNAQQNTGQPLNASSILGAIIRWMFSK